MVISPSFYQKHEGGGTSGVPGGKTHEIVVSCRSFILMVICTQPVAASQNYHLNVPSSVPGKQISTMILCIHLSFHISG